MEAQPTKLVGSLGSKNRYFDFDKLAEVWFSFVKSLLSSSHKPYFFEILISYKKYCFVCAGHVNSHNKP